MGLLNKLFGTKHRVNEAPSHLPFPVTGYFFEIGAISDMYMQRDLIERAEQILRFINRKGCIAKMLIFEPSPGYWGDTSKKYLESAANALISQVTMYEAESHEGEYMINLNGEKQKLSDSSVFSEMHQDAKIIKNAMETDRVKFMIGNRSNKCKILAVLIHK